MKLCLGSNIPIFIENNNDNISYHSEDDNIAYVTDTGIIKGKAVGNTRIITKIKDENNEVAEYYTKVNVIKESRDNDIISTKNDVEGIKIVNPIQKLEIGEIYPVTALLYPLTYKDDNLVHIKSSDESICSVTYGVLFPIKAGVCTISATDISTNTFIDSFELTVANPVTNNILDSEIYNVVLPCITDNGILHIDGTNAIETTNAIKDLLNYAHNKNYKKIIFPCGEYHLYPTDFINIYIPSDLIIDFSSSVLQIEESDRTNGLDTAVYDTRGYTMFTFDKGIKNSKIINAKIYGEQLITTKTDTSYMCKCVTFGYSENCGLENCEISRSPGFNISFQNNTIAYGGWFNADRLEEGNIDDEGNNIKQTNCWRTNQYEDLGDVSKYNEFVFGNSNDYLGYNISSRLYDIFFFDKEYNLLEVQRKNHQYYQYSIPQNAKYVKIVIFQENKPNNVGDFAVAGAVMVINQPYKCYIKNCIIEDNYSTGIAVVGGRRIIIEGSEFRRNKGRDPSCDIDWEDGWDMMNGHICRNNIFESYAGVIVNAGMNLVYYGNLFKENSWFAFRGLTQNCRIFNNLFYNLGVELTGQTDEVFANNCLVYRNYSIKDKLHSDGNYSIRCIDNNFISK